MSQNIPRRTLAKGAAWAAPVVAASATIPAYASSQKCTTTASLYSNTYFNYGEAKYDQYGNYYSAQTAGFWQLALTRIEITGLDSDETVKSVTFTLHVEDRDYYADPDNLPAGYYNPLTLGSVETYNAPGDGWSRSSINDVSSHTITVNGTSHTADMWSVVFTSDGQGTYSTASTGTCRNYVSTDLAPDKDNPYEIYYEDIWSLAMGNGDYVPNQHFQIIAMTSKGRSITVNGFILNQKSTVDLETVIS